MTDQRKARRVTRLERTADGTAWNLYVNNAPAVTHETHAVCAAVEAAIQGSEPRGYYSEAAEIADVIRRERGRT